MSLAEVYARITSTDAEVRRVVEFVAGATGRDGKVLDVGCGVGRYLRRFRERGIDAAGVDANRDIVEANRATGLACMTIEEFAHTRDLFDVVLMSHVIEHFQPGDLLRFLDEYLDRLKMGGVLVIATPLASNNFFDDFDHVKPYQPAGLMMVFGTGGAQVQYYSRNRLQLTDLWYRRSHLRVNHARGRMIRSGTSRLLQLIDVASAILFRLSLGSIGRTDGWVGTFRKIEGP